MKNKYTQTARIYPAIISSFPIFILNHFLLNIYTANILESFEKIKWFGEITLSVVLMFLLSHISRFIGKEIYETIHFYSELKMPTVETLLHSDSTYSKEHKIKIHSKIFTDFGIKLYSFEEERVNNMEARKNISEAISLIRAKIKDGRLVVQHNAEYGFVRNLVGGSVLAIFVCIINLFIFGSIHVNPIAFYTSLILAIVYLPVIIFSRFLLNRYGMRYSKILIQEYLVA